MMKKWIIFGVVFFVIVLISQLISSFDQNSYKHYSQSRNSAADQLLQVRLASLHQANISSVDIKEHNKKHNDGKLFVLNAHYKNVMIYSSVAITIILLVLFLIYRKHTLKLKRLNRQLEDKQKELVDHHYELNQLYHDQQKLITILAHDLNAPFDRIKGLAFILLHSENLHYEQIEVVKKIELTAENSKKLVDDIIFSFKQDEEHKEPEKEDLDCVKFFEDIIDTHQHYAKKKNIGLNTNIEPITIRSNASYLSRITDNLLSNAIKFSPKGGEVSLELHKSNKGFCFSVQDNGPGISLEEQKLLFKRFQKLSNRPTGGEHSTGLGLSITKSLVDKLNGNIEVESDKGKGTKFIICIPDE